ncbi:hypothetical protein FOCC_FOCC008378 [Frankliniella occidentalis]|nr:hypothetical protein FOCC_FOCC008378 [Frankliniella occidentalis]
MEAATTVAAATTATVTSALTEAMATMMTATTSWTEVPASTAAPAALHVMGWVDLAVLACMLAVSTAIGVYFAYFVKGANESEADYLVGGRTMSMVPVALSLFASGHLFNSESKSMMHAGV